MRFIHCTIATLLALCLGSALSTRAETAATRDSVTDLADHLVRAYHAGDIETLRPHLAPGLVFHPWPDSRQGLAQFVDRVEKMGEGDEDRALEINWVGVAGDLAEVRGTWRWTDIETDRTSELRFSIELELDTSGAEPRVVGWRNDFRRRSMWKPAKGDVELETEHFRLVYFKTEFSAEAATRLGATLEKWYEETRRYLARSLDPDHRLQINIADCHESPFASDPGPEAFILVSSRSARHAYGFSLVHELTHNLMGLSWLSRHEFERDGVEIRSGNRLFDGGFAVFVEEELTGEGPQVWPNFGQETHAAYWQLRQQRGAPIWPVLDAEVHRDHGDARLAYLAQASFTKHLVETHGLDRFLRLFASDPAAAPEIYGRDFAELESDWRRFLEGRFGESDAAESGE